MDYDAFPKLEFRRKFWKLVGAEISVVDPATDKLAGFISAKAWRLREDVRLYTDRDMATEVFRIHARNVIDFAGTYDVLAGPDDTPRFTLRRKGLRSTFVRDHWLIQDATGQPLGELRETSSGLALARRWIGVVPFVGELIDLALSFAPQSYRLTDADGKLLGAVLRRKNPFVVKLELDRTAAEATADPYLGAAVCALLSIIDAQK